MQFKKFFKEFAKIFFITLIVSSLVTYLWQLVFHGVGVADWETAFRFAIIFGIIFGLKDLKDG